MRRICHCTIYYTKKYNSDTYQENLQKIQVMKRVPSIFVTFCSIAILMMISTPSWGGEEVCRSMVVVSVRLKA